MAYISATIVVGLKLLGTVCHGPEVTRMVERATSAEAQFEASLQLILLGSIYLVSGNGSSESRNSAITSLLVIGKVGVQNFFKKHDKELSKASLLGRICIAASISPAFVLVALYKIGSLACVATVDTDNYIVVLRSAPMLLFLIIPLPALVIFLVKKDLTAASIAQGVFSEVVCLHFWPGHPFVYPFS